MKLAGTFPTPYGVAVPVYRDESHADDDSFIFDIDATATCMGIYDANARKRFVDDMTKAGRIDVDNIDRYGGRRLLHISLPRPSEPATPQIPSHGGIPFDNWIDLVMDRSRWCDRAEVLIGAIGGNFDNRHEASLEPFLALGLQILLSGALEHLGEREIDCLEAAAFYALSMHDEWRAAAIEWLVPVADTWWRDWIDARPTYSRFAALCRQNADLPLWIKGRASC